MSPHEGTRSQLENRVLRLEEEIRAMRDRSHSSSPWLTLEEVCESVGLSRWTIWRKVKSDDFPAPCKPSAQVSRWSQEEVERWKREQLRNRRSAP